ncbi:7872_t:CDS:2 [Cetraspora pellucida]|uniref:7872_t:CDS:1 n=1 Tax=Cetraspora pellucida TaxID=1433469 RepID=A0ACA9MU56_9GLOM|nr:7872_t:CDS:2 [Cetraspora pellucida]
MTHPTNKRKRLQKVTKDREAKKRCCDINIYEIINSLDKEELIKVQNYINSINLPNVNIYEILNPLDQDELIKIQNYIDLINHKRQSSIKKKLDALINKIKNLPDNQILSIEHLINTMTYSKGKTKIKKLETENKKLAKSLSTSNSELRSFYMKIVRAEEAKQKYISRIQSVAQKSKKITKSQFQIAAKRMIKENNHVYTAEFVKLATDISNIGTISLLATAECIKLIIAFFTGEMPDHSLSTKTLSQ